MIRLFLVGVFIGLAGQLVSAPYVRGVEALLLVLVITAAVLLLYSIPLHPPRVLLRRFRRATQ